MSSRYFSSIPVEGFGQQIAAHSVSTPLKSTSSLFLAVTSVALPGLSNERVIKLQVLFASCEKFASSAMLATC